MRRLQIMHQPLPIITRGFPLHVGTDIHQPSIAETLVQPSAHTVRLDEALQAQLINTVMTPFHH